MEMDIEFLEFLENDFETVSIENVIKHFFGSEAIKTIKQKVNLTKKHEPPIKMENFLKPPPQGSTWQSDLTFSEGWHVKFFRLLIESDLFQKSKSQYPSKTNPLRIKIDPLEYLLWLEDNQKILKSFLKPREITEKVIEDIWVTINRVPGLKKEYQQRFSKKKAYSTKQTPNSAKAKIKRTAKSIFKENKNIKATQLLYKSEILKQLVPEVSVTTVKEWDDEEFKKNCGVRPKYVADWIREAKNELYPKNKIPKNPKK